MLVHTLVPWNEQLNYSWFPPVVDSFVRISWSEAIFSWNHLYIEAMLNGIFFGFSRIEGNVATIHMDLFPSRSEKLNVQKHVMWMTDKFIRSKPSTNDFLFTTHRARAWFPSQLHALLSNLVLCRAFTHSVMLCAIWKGRNPTSTATIKIAIICSNRPTITTICIRVES